jgi:hypothetical protein
MSESPPRQLSVVPISPFYNKEWISRIDKVSVDGVHLPNCRAYDIDAGWAAAKENGVFQPKVHGVVTVTVKPKRKV